jgi:MFS family permease
MNSLRRYYLYAFLNGLQFTFTTWLAFVVARGGNAGWAESAFHVAILVGEVPTGAVADLLGRRTSMLVGLSFGLLTPILFLNIHGTVSACIVLAITGLGGTFLSGADTALLYETAVAEGGPDLARKALARANALQLGALAAAPLMAGFLYQWNGLAPAIGRAVICLCAIPVVWGMHEEAKPIHAERRSILSQTRTAISLVRQNRLALTLILFSWVYNTAGSMAGQFGQVYFPYVGLSMAATGLVFTASSIFSTGGSFLAGRIRQSSALRLLRFAPLVAAGALFAMGRGSSWLGVACFILFGAVDGILYPIFQHQLNESIPSAYRATILSLQAAGVSLLMSVAFPAAAALRPITQIYVVTGGVSVLLALVWLATRSTATPRSPVESGAF